ncbi:MAG: FGGY family carbohydrate kinase [Bacteroidales bacterium]
MKDNYILSLELGTQSVNGCVFDAQGNALQEVEKELYSLYPKRSWVEHDPNELWYTAARVAAETLLRNNIEGEQLAAFGIANQRETVVVWNRETGKPIYNGICWQDRRTLKFCEDLQSLGYEDIIKLKTGLRIDPYFSASKLSWILNEVTDARKLAKAGKLAFGTVDSWLLYKFSGGKIHKTDISNASRTLLYNIHLKCWDKELLKIFDIPESILPEVVDSCGLFGYTTTTIFTKKIPITAVLGNQQAALFGHSCFYPGDVKNTFSTGSYLMMNTGVKPAISTKNLLTTIAWSINGCCVYALEGSIFGGTGLYQWLRDGIGICNSVEEMEMLASSVPDSEGVYFVPALSGLGAPFWDHKARGGIMGLTPSVTSAHIARAVLEGVAFQSRDVLKAMEMDSDIKIPEIHVDGRYSQVDLLIQIYSDILNIPVKRLSEGNSVLQGIAWMAALGVGLYSKIEDLKLNKTEIIKYTSSLDSEIVFEKQRKWRKALLCAMNWEL